MFCNISNVVGVKRTCFWRHLISFILVTGPKSENVTVNVTVNTCIL